MRSASNPEQADTRSEPRPQQLGPFRCWSNLKLRAGSRADFVVWENRSSAPALPVLPCWWQVPARNRQLAGRGACTADEIVKHVHALAGCTRTSWEGREYVLQAVGRIMRGLPEFTNL